MSMDSLNYSSSLAQRHPNAFDICIDSVPLFMKILKSIEYFVGDYINIVLTSDVGFSIQEIDVSEVMVVKIQLPLSFFFSFRLHESLGEYRISFRKSELLENIKNVIQSKCSIMKLSGKLYPNVSHSLSGNADNNPSLYHRKKSPCESLQDDRMDNEIHINDNSGNNNSKCIIEYKPGPIPCSRIPETQIKHFQDFILKFDSTRYEGKLSQNDYDMKLRDFFFEMTTQSNGRVFASQKEQSGNSEENPIDTTTYNQQIELLRKKKEDFLYAWAWKKRLERANRIDFEEIPNNGANFSRSIPLFENMSTQEIALDLNSDEYFFVKFSTSKLLDIIKNFRKTTVGAQSATEKSLVDNTSFITFTFQSDMREISENMHEEGVTIEPTQDSSIRSTKQMKIESFLLMEAFYSDASLGRVNMPFQLREIITINKPSRFSSRESPHSINKDVTPTTTTYSPKNKSPKYEESSSLSPSTNTRVCPIIQSDAPELIVSNLLASSFILEKLKDSKSVADNPLKNFRVTFTFSYLLKYLFSILSKAKPLSKDVFLGFRKADGLLRIYFPLYNEFPMTELKKSSQETKRLEKKKRTNKKKKTSTKSPSVTLKNFFGRKIPTNSEKMNLPQLRCKEESTVTLEPREPKDNMNTQTSSLLIKETAACDSTSLYNSSSISHNDKNEDDGNMPYHYVHSFIVDENMVKERIGQVIFIVSPCDLSALRGEGSSTYKSDTNKTVPDDSSKKDSDLSPKIEQHCHLPSHMENIHHTTLNHEGENAFILSTNDKLLQSHNAKDNEEPKKNHTKSKSSRPCYLKTREPSKKKTKNSLIPTYPFISNYHTSSFTYECSYIK